MTKNVFTTTPKKTGMNKAVKALVILGGILLLKKLFSRKKKSGYYEKLGEKMDHKIDSIKAKARN